MFSLSFRLPFSQALGAARRRGALLPNEYYALPAEYRRLAFTVRGLITLDQIEAVQQSLQEALRGGLSFAEWKATAAPIEAFRLTDARLETIFRTHAQTAYMSGHHRAMVANAQRRPYWMYSAINDERTRPAHRAMSGYIARWDDPVWQKWFPPAGFNCRCTVISLTADQARARGHPMNPRAGEPDDGFAGVPTQERRKLDQLLQRRVQQLGSIFTRAFDDAITKQLRPSWLNRANLAAARAGLANLMRSNPIYAALTPAEFFAIVKYTAPRWYRELNRRLRFDADVSAFTAMQLGVTQHLASAIHKMEGGVARTIYRGMPLNEKDVERLMLGLKEGRPVMTSAFFSASLSRDVAMRWARPKQGRPVSVLFEIETQLGMRVDRISQFGAVEMEIILAPGATLRVVSFDRIKNLLVVRLRDGSGTPTIGLSA